MITNSITEIIAVLEKSDVAGIPTETVYGLAANIYDEQALSRIFELKGRPKTNPLIVHIHSLEQISEVCGKLSEKEKNYLNKIQNFWPGPISAILPKHPRLSSLITAGQDTVAVRIPNHPLCLQLLREYGKPLAAPSANKSQSISPTCASDVIEEFGGDLTVLDGGKCEVGLESTVVNLTTQPHPVILRPGAVTKEDLSESFNVDYQDLFLDPYSTQASPGQSIKHYSPVKPLHLSTCNHNPGTSYLIYFSDNSAQKADQYMASTCLSSNNNLDEVAHNLFAALRKADHSSAQQIIIDSCSIEGIGKAIFDRISRAISK